MKTLGRRIVQPGVEQIRDKRIVLNPDVLSTGDWMQINGMGEGYPYPQKESPLNQETKVKGFSKKNFKLPKDAPVNMIEGMVTQLSEVGAKNWNGPVEEMVT